MCDRRLPLYEGLAGYTSSCGPLIEAEFLISMARTNCQWQWQCQSRYRFLKCCKNWNYKENHNHDRRKQHIGYMPKIAWDRCASAICHSFLPLRNHNNVIYADQAFVLSNIEWSIAPLYKTHICLSSLLCVCWPNCNDNI